METLEVQDRVLAIVKAILVRNAISSDLHPELRLVDAGLTSMDMVNLMLDVEAEFDFTIPQDEITPENFQSVKTLERLVINQLGIRPTPLNLPLEVGNRGFEGA